MTLERKRDQARIGWRLIAILASSVPLDEALSRWLYETAVDLHASGQEMVQVGGDLGSGMVRNLREEAVLGTIGGPTFEAVIDSERGRGKVRFLVTREGLEARGRAAARGRTLN